MTELERVAEARRAALGLGMRGAVLTAAFALLSGPVSLWVVNATHPEPPWRDAATFVASYHPIPGWALTLPGLIGFGIWNVLVIAMAIAAAKVFRRRLLDAA